ncbi:hypothetical protein L291_1948 [Acinetobacter guillouiae MSP4-18]|uniref:DUF4291 domain-containing protein n=1 Tax=Acinetobacter guillouiae TaxID=106649 RepID=UPI0002D0CA97|nr:DUF4291 domain-containing protein [Acinetobacter guillouiae]ENU58303.1 hypothetical protein F981_02591 [Acinetobacter guillouiae CIP 63.46]EPH38725.1 hypothetical protein L291_1948 [Acinetobacter guillouiae MSP4-18]KAB0626409.1 DUF4291 domain-containing protein [Acinetobacter guillouiae]
MSAYHQIRALYDRDTITVYQAYNQQIAQLAVQQQKFVSPFSFHRMTWIKPSFLWLMERSHWATKSNQNHILAIRVKRDFWEYLLQQSIHTDPILSAHKNGEHWFESFENAKVHIQWDPERNLKGTKLEQRSIQIGISRFLIQAFNNTAIHSIQDITPLVTKMAQFRRLGKYKHAEKLLPKQRIYPLNDALKKHLVIG